MGAEDSVRNFTPTPLSSVSTASLSTRSAMVRDAERPSRLAGGLRHVVVARVPGDVVDEPLVELQEVHTQRLALRRVRVSAQRLRNTNTSVVPGPIGMRNEPTHEKPWLSK